MEGARYEIKFNFIQYYLFSYTPFRNVLKFKLSFFFFSFLNNIFVFLNLIEHSNVYLEKIKIV